MDFLVERQQDGETILAGNVVVAGSILSLPRIQNLLRVGLYLEYFVIMYRPKVTESRPGQFY